MSHQDETFFTSVGCMDGRVHDPVTNYGIDKFHALYGDTITEAGLVGLLAKEQIDKELLDSLRNKIGISITKHNSKGMVIHGHQECAGNTVDDQKHKKDILKAVDVLRNFTPDDFEIKPVFVVRKGSSWEIEEL